MNFTIFLCLDLLEDLASLFGLQNILPVVFNMKKLNYFFASLLGFIPIFFIWNTIGAGLDKYIKQSKTLT